MTEQAKSGGHRLGDLFARIKDQEVWNRIVAEVREECPGIDNIEPTEKKWHTFADLLETKIDNHEALQRIENGNAEYEEIMGLSK